MIAIVIVIPQKQPSLAGFVLEEYVFSALLNTLLDEDPPAD